MKTQKAAWCLAKLPHMKKLLYRYINTLETWVSTFAEFPVKHAKWKLNKLPLEELLIEFKNQDNL